MTIWQRLRQFREWVTDFFSDLSARERDIHEGMERINQRLAAERAVAMTPNARGLGGGRVSIDTINDFALDGWVIVPPNDFESAWRAFHLDAKTLDRLPPADLLEMLADLSPEVSRAIWDFLRLLNPGWECKALLMGDSDEPDTTAQAALDAFMAALTDLHGSPDIVFGRIFLGAYLRGGLCSELVLDARGRLPIDLATPDPYSIRFRKRKDPVRKEVWQPGQWQNSNFVPLDIPTFKYLPIDPMPGVPYGRPLAAPALFTAIFLLSMLHDIRRVVQQQGYKRLDISIDTERLGETIPDAITTPEQFRTWMVAIIEQVKDEYKKLQPDDAFIHPDILVLNQPVGSVDTDSMAAFDKLITKLEGMITRALKSMPLLMGMNISASDTDSNRQYEIFAAGVKSLQHYCETMLESLLTLGLEAQGIQARVQFRFAELRAAEMLRDAQTEQMRIANEREKYKAGWTSQDEASEAITGHEADQPEPRDSGGGEAQMQQDDNDGSEALNQGSDRMMPNGYGGAGQRVKIIPDGADEPLTPVPEEVTITDADRDRAVREWDELMPDYAGLLDATVVNGDSEGEERSVRAETGSVWTWDGASRRYRNTETGRYIGQRQMTDLRDAFVEAKRSRAGTLAESLAKGDISLQEWELAFRREIKTVFVDQFVLGRGGRNAMTSQNWGQVGRLVRDQYQFAHQFAADIAAGKLSQAQIASRAGLYIDSSTQAFERGRSASFGLSLPQYPADGSQQCRSNCKCEWVIVETETDWECTWRTHTKESCDTCLANASSWNPLVIQKAGRSRAEVERILEGMTNGHH